MLLLAAAVAATVYITDPDQFFPRWRYVPLQRIDQLAKGSITVFEASGAGGAARLPDAFAANRRLRAVDHAHAVRPALIFSMRIRAGNFPANRCPPTRVNWSSAPGTAPISNSNASTPRHSWRARCAVPSAGGTTCSCWPCPAPARWCRPRRRHGCNTRRRWSPPRWFVMASPGTSSRPCASSRPRRGAWRRATCGARVSPTPAFSHRKDEFSELAHDFDEMAVRIDDLLTAQRRLIADISHELGSPLTRVNVALGLAFRKAGRGGAPRTRTHPARGATRQRTDPPTPAALRTGKPRARRSAGGDRPDRARP